MIDEHCAHPAQVTYEMLVGLFYKEGLRNVLEAISFFQRRELLPQLASYEWDWYSEVMKQRRILDEVDGAWYDGIIKNYLSALLSRQRKNMSKGYAGENLRPKPRTITSNIGAAKAFLSFLEINEESSIRSLSQDDLDHFLSERAGYSNAIRPFINYLNREVRLFRRIKVPADTRNLPIDSYIGQNRATEIIQQCLRQNGSDSRDALIVVLLLLYAQSAHAIVKLRTDDVVFETPKVASLRFPTHLLFLSPEVTELLKRHIKYRRTKCASDNIEENQYLFPGRMAGNHLSSTSIPYLTKKYGYRPRQLYSTALINFYAAGVRHPKVLVKALGVTLITAMKYFNLMNIRLDEEVAQWYSLNG